MTDAMKLLKEQEQDPEDMHFSPEHLAKLIELIDKNVINRTVAHTVFEAIFKDDVDPEEYVESHGLKVVNDEGEVKAKIEEIIAANPQSVADFKAGKQKAMGFIVGQTMRAMKGKADPAVVNALVKELLSR
jgi:aspartyl-tRNA(Asn)/glutamyl-tRNA(Gln) amidotransferase subunit B